jgi:hypothetical protein
MTRDHFSKTFKSPYFQSDAYQETPGGKWEKRIEEFLKRFFKKEKKNVL